MVVHVGGRSVSEPVTMAMFGDSSIYQGRMTSMLVALFDEEAFAQFESGMVFRGFAAPTGRGRQLFRLFV